MKNIFYSNSRQILAGRVGWICSFPRCNMVTVGASHTDNNRMTILGEAAHIRSGNPGGPRYDSSLTYGQCNSPENGIWMCRHHARLIDLDINKYTIEKLIKWKKNAEQKYQRSIQNPLTYQIPLGPKKTGNIKHYKQWSLVANNIADYISDYLMKAHRGALLFDSGITVVFGNDGYDYDNSDLAKWAETVGLQFSQGKDKRAKMEVKSFRSLLNSYSLTELGFGLSKDRYTWCLLVASDKTDFLNDKIWTCYSFNLCQKDTAQVVLSPYRKRLLSNYLGCQ